MYINEDEIGSLTPIQLYSRFIWRNPQLLQTEDVQQSMGLYTIHNGYIYMYTYIGYSFHNVHKTLPSHIMYNLKYKSND